MSKQHAETLLKNTLKNGDKLMFVQTGGTSQNKQVEIIAAPYAGQPENITSAVCSMLDKKRAGRNRNGGMRLSNWEGPQDVVNHLSEKLKITLYEA